jgi:hypothetical protein
MQTTVLINDDGSGTMECVLHATGSFKYDLVRLALKKMMFKRNSL